MDTLTFIVEVLKNHTAFISAIAWPAVPVLCLMLFKSQLRELISRVVEISDGKRKVKFAETRRLAAEAELVELRASQVASLSTCERANTSQHVAGEDRGGADEIPVDQDAEDNWNADTYFLDMTNAPLTFPEIFDAAWAKLTKTLAKFGVNETDDEVMDISLYPLVSQGLLNRDDIDVILKLKSLRDDIHRAPEMANLNNAGPFARAVYRLCVALTRRSDSGRGCAVNSVR